MGRMYYKAGDTLPKLVATIYNENGEVVPLEAATAVTFSLKNQVTQQVILSRVAAAFDDKPNGKVSYTWQANDLITPGDYIGEFRLSWTGAPQTAPQNRYIYLTVNPGIS